MHNPSDAEVAAALSDITGTPVDITTIKINSFPYAYGSPATGGPGWSLFVKQLHHVRLWPGLVHMPPEIAGTVPPPPVRQ